MTELNFNIISSDMDMELFTNKEYEGKVKKALDKLKRKHHITKKNMCDFSILCYHSGVELYQGRKYIDFKMI